MTLPTPAGLLKIPVFLENGTQDWALPPPLGLQGSEEMVAQALKASFALYWCTYWRRDLQEMRGGRKRWHFTWQKSWTSYRPIQHYH